MKIQKLDNMAVEGNSSYPSEISIGLKTDRSIFIWNKAAENIFGYLAIEAVGQDISIIFSENNFPREKKMLENILEGDSFQYEICCKTKLGERICVLFNASPIMDKMGKVMGISKIATDVTDQNEMEKKIATLASIVDSSDDAIISKTLNGIITSWNRSATKMFGYTEDEAIGRHISLLIPPESVVEEELIMENIIKGEKIDHFETARIAKDGTEKFISLTVSPIKNRKGDVIGVSKIARDIADKDQQDEKQAILAAIVNSSDDAIISKTLQGIITSWNQAAFKMFGYTEEEAIGKHISLIIPKDRLDEETKIIESLSRGEKIDHFETIRIAKNGALRDISLTISPIRGRRGKIIGASKIARDISMRKEAEKQRQNYTKRLQELNKYKDEFMVMASHELKTPLTVIMANLQVLHEMMENDPHLILLEKVLKQVNKLSKLISNLLNVSKIEAGQLELNPTKFDLNELLAELIDNLQQTTKDHKIIYAKKQRKLMINADREKIEQVVINLISNAIKYSRETGRIIVNATQNTDVVRVNVKDEGIGIPKEDLENIFLRFFRVSGSASSYSGSGVGLYISSEIIKNHGGKLWAESEIGKGSVFNFSLPAAKEE
ncbi:MAG: PAS domain S-box protein [Ginsengibacter sp.]